MELLGGDHLNAVLASKFEIVLAVDLPTEPHLQCISLCQQSLFDSATNRSAVGMWAAEVSALSAKRSADQTPSVMVPRICPPPERSNCRTTVKGVAPLRAMDLVFRPSASNTPEIDHVWFPSVIFAVNDLRAVVVAAKYPELAGTYDELVDSAHASDFRQCAECVRLAPHDGRFVHRASGIAHVGVQVAVRRKPRRRRIAGCLPVAATTILPSSSSVKPRSTEVVPSCRVIG